MIALATTPATWADLAPYIIPLAAVIVWALWACRGWKA